jgi:hypothetical protein
MLIRPFYHIRQITSVSDYIECFEVLVNHLTSYSDQIHPLYVLTKFVEGLRKDIRAAVMVQRPADIYTACSLACLQEEIIDGLPFADTGHQLLLPAPAAPLLLTAPPQRAVPAGLTQAQDRRGTDAAHATDSSSKLAALKAYRKSRGLCFKCGESWGREHTCPSSVQLHVLQELLDVVGYQEEGESMQLAPPEETVMAISYQAISGSDSGSVMQLQAWVQGHEVFMLIDSGSSTSFVSTELAAVLKGLHNLPKPVRVKVADGGELNCTQEIPACPWFTQGHQFRTAFKVIALGAYDVILGLDWLKAHSPMKHVDWEKKTMCVTDQGQEVFLKGCWGYCYSSLDSLYDSMLCHDQPRVHCSRISVVCSGHFSRRDSS